MAYVEIPNTSSPVGGPGKASLFTQLWDNLIAIWDKLGTHVHDGVGSAAIEIGPNLVRNGSFESDGTGWTTTAYTGGTVAVSTTNNLDGAKCLAFTSTSTANGGGDAVSNEFVPVTGSAEVLLKWAMIASTANVSSKVEVLWYDEAQGAISATTVFSATSTNTTAKRRQRIAVAPSTARYCKVRITGGVPGSGSATGVIYFDGVKLMEPQGALVPLDELTASSSASLAFTEGLDQPFDVFELQIVKVIPATNNEQLVMQFSNDGGATYVSTASHHWTQHDVSSAAAEAITGSQTATSCALVPASGISNATQGGGFSGTVRFDAPALAATQYITGRVQGTRWVGTGPLHTNTGGFLASAGAAVVNAVRLAMVSGNIASGTVRLCGVRKGV